MPTSSTPSSARALGGCWGQHRPIQELIPQQIQPLAPHSAIRINYRVQGYAVQCDLAVYRRPIATMNHKIMHML